MKNKLGFSALFFVACALVIYTSCKKVTVQVSNTGGTPELPATPYEYMQVSTPEGTLDLKTMFMRFNSGGVFIDPIVSFPPTGFKGNENMSNASVALGRVLFYDKRLSINNTVACASCHKQSMAFSDGKALSFGFGDKKTSRNSMAIITPLSMNSLFWDSRAESALDLSLRPVFNHVEMGMESDAMLVKKIQSEKFYNKLFTDAYGSPVVNRDNIASAISDFLNSMVTRNSKFDQGSVNGFANFTAMEKLGKDLFFSSRLNCTSCHAGKEFSAPDNPGDAYSAPSVKGTANIGLDFNYTDNGKGNGKFRIPSLRNIELTGPYMHDGRFATLEEVLEHYSSGIKSHPDLDANLKLNGMPRRMNLTPTEKAAVVAFLKTLTDKSFVTDVRYSNPFKS